MPDDTKKSRKRVVVEEIGASEPETKPEVADSVEKAMETISEPVEEIREKVEELQDLTEEIGESAEKSAEIEEEIVEVAEKAAEPEKEPEERPTSPASYAPPYQRKDGINPLLILIPGVLILGALIGGIYFYQKGVKVSTTETPTPSAAPLATSPSATPSTTADLSKYTIAVQNGSGIAGEAGKVKKLLEDAGFKVGSAGNAATYDFKETIIKHKEGVDSAYIEKLKQTLSAEYKLAATETLPASSKDEVVIVVGSTKAD